MRNRIIGLAIAGALAVGVVAGGAVGARPEPAEALTASQATTAYNAFVSTYWNSSAKYFYTYSNRAVGAHNSGPQGGLYTDYWWEAQAWEAVMDRYARTHDAASRQMIDDVYDGWVAMFPDFRKNDWNDDMGWWARGSIRAYELTGEQRFLTQARTIFDYIAQYEDTTYGGGIWWKNVDVGNGAKNEKNVATNGTAVQTALRIYQATGIQSYRDTATRIFGWLKTNFYGGGHIRDHISGTGQFSDFDWTYNFGQYAGAALQLYLVTNDRQYLTQATTAIDWAVANLTVSGVFLDEGRDDTGGFKAILTRDIRALIDLGGQTQYRSLLATNASQAMNHLSTQGVGGSDWNAQTPSIQTTPQQSLTAAAAVAIAQQADADGSSAIVQGTGVYQAENVGHAGIGTEASNGGYTGRGYLAGWNADGTAAVFPVNVATAGSRTVTLRFSAAAGTASRAIVVNGQQVGTVSFAGTSAWSEWRTVTASVPLRAGSNTVSVAFTASAGSANYLNLDSLSVTL